MKQPVPAPRKEPPQASLRVRYYRRMKPQRVYPLSVEVGGAGAVPLGQQPVTLRPVVPGALVVPAEHRAEALRPGERYTFSVTPLARGRLPEARLEVGQPGRPAQPIPLRMKGVTQRLTWLLLALTILVPLGIIYVTSPPGRLKGDVPHLVTVPDVGGQGIQPAAAAAGEAQAAERPGDKDKEAPKPGDKDKDAAKPGDQDKDQARPGDQSKNATKPEKAGQGEKPEGAARDRQPGTGRRGGRAGERPRGVPDVADLPAGVPVRPGMPPRRPADQEAPPPVVPPAGTQREMLVAESPGAVLTYRLDHALKTGLPAANEVLPSEPAAKAVRDAWDATAPHVTWRLGWLYDILCNAPTAWLWIGLFLLGLTVLSWLFHGARRASRRAVLLLAPVASHETRPLGPADRPLAVDQV